MATQAVERAAHEAVAQSVADKPYSRFCNAADVVGTWYLVKFQTPYQFKDQHAPYLLPHQIFQFSQDGNMKSAHSAKPFKENPAMLFETVPSAVNYAFEHDGKVTLKAKGASTIAETWHCVAITQDENDGKHHVSMKRGDLVMTLVGKQGQAVFTRQLRK